jgi:hypothetical protein
LPTQVSLLTLTLTRGPMSLATMVSEPASHLLAVGSGTGRQRLSFLYWLLTLTCGPVTIFWNETCFPKLLEPIKQHLKSQKYEQFIFGHLLFE